MSLKFIIDYSKSNTSKISDWLEFSYDNWDDYGYKTTFRVVYHNKAGQYKHIGGIQIGFSGMEGGQVYKELDKSFNGLAEGFFR